MNIKEYKKQLLSSPLFNLSLSSKELFHSNFIAFLINNDSRVVRYIFDKYIDVKWSDKIYVEREKNNFDLVLYDEQNCVIIENKVKSIPNIYQLLDYKEKSKKIYKDFNRVLILLTIHQPSNLECEELKDWTIFTYVDILEGLKKYILNNTDGYINQLIDDYINYMSNFIKLVTMFKISKGQSIYVDESTLTDLKELRIHDLFYKSRFEDLKAILKDSITKQYGSKYNIIEGNEWYSLNTQDILVDHNFTRGTGLFEFKIPICIKNNEKYILGVQLQNRAFKLSVQSLNKTTVRLLAKKLYESKLWFDFSILNTACTIVDRQKKEYCQYDKEGLMLYKYKEIKDISKEKIINVFNDYLKHIFANKESITNICNTIE